jgi:hypothetical protein
MNNKRKMKKKKRLRIYISLLTETLKRAGNLSKEFYDIDFECNSHKHFQLIFTAMFLCAMGYSISNTEKLFFLSYCQP